MAIRPPETALFKLIGILLTVAGIVAAIAGGIYVFHVVREFDSFGADGPPGELADGLAVAFWGIIAFTLGRYAARGARRTGGRDRFGRILIAVGYLMLGIALDRGVHSAIGLWGAPEAEGGQSAAVRTLVTVGLWGVPATIIAVIGTKLASGPETADAQ